MYPTCGRTLRTGRARAALPIVFISVDTERMSDHFFMSSIYSYIPPMGNPSAWRSLRQWRCGSRSSPVARVASLKSLLTARTAGLWRNAPQKRLQQRLPRYSMMANYAYDWARARGRRSETALHLANSALPLHSDMRV